VRLERRSTRSLESLRYIPQPIWFDGSKRESFGEISPGSLSLNSPGFLPSLRPHCNRMSESPAPAPTPTPVSTAPRRKQENLWINLICNALLPGLLLTKLSPENRLGPMWALIVSLSLPLGYGIWDLVSRKKWNVISIVGLIGVLFTGGFGLFKLPNHWFAVKEAVLPLVLGLAIPMSMRTRQPLVRALLYNDQVLNTTRIETALVEKGNLGPFEKLLLWASWVLAASFFLSGALNYLLARWLVTATPGSSEQTAQIGKLHWVSWPVIVLPSMAVMFFALFRLMKGIEQLTGLKTDDLFHSPAPKSQTA
jgi:hypothetical protein